MNMCFNEASPRLLGAGGPGRAGQRRSPWPLRQCWLWDAKVWVGGKPSGMRLLAATGGWVTLCGKCVHVAVVGLRRAAWLPVPSPTPPSSFAAPAGGTPAAPLLTDSDSEGDGSSQQPSTSGRQPEGEPPHSGGAWVLGALKRAIRPLANLKLAIAELAVIAGLSSIGTVIEQGRPYQYYAQAYPEDGPKALGFVTGKLIWALQWDHIYSTDYFLLLIATLGASLVACTWTNQWPAAKVAQRWRFLDDTQSFARLPQSGQLPSARVGDLGQLLADRRYQVGGLEQARLGCMMSASRCSSRPPAPAV